MDLYLPRLDGIKATQKIHKFLRKNHVRNNPYICLLTGADTTHLTRKIRDLGINKVVRKPIFKHGVQKLLIDAQLLTDCTSH